MSKYLLDVILLAIIWCIPFAVIRLSLRNRRAKNAIYNSAQKSTAMPPETETFGF